MVGAFYLNKLETHSRLTQDKLLPVQDAARNGLTRENDTHNTTAFGERAGAETAARSQLQNTRNPHSSSSAYKMVTHSHSLPLVPLEVVVVVAVVLPLYEAAAADGENVSTDSEPEASVFEESAGDEEAVDEAVEAPDERLSVITSSGGELLAARGRVELLAARVVGGVAAAGNGELLAAGLRAGDVVLLGAVRASDVILLAAVFATSDVVALRAVVRRGDASVRRSASGAAGVVCRRAGVVCRRAGVVRRRAGVVRRRAGVVRGRAGLASVGRAGARVRGRSSCVR
ncbi:hypothetical protein ON010_g16987 [Phytophthora cinnamomi]|nr:hypothetical protein ON010_g16987 [Phytophthora cinnamomi]